MYNNLFRCIITDTDVINISPSGEIIPLIAVRVVSLSGHKIDISVVPNKLSTIGCKFANFDPLFYFLKLSWKLFPSHFHKHIMCSTR